MSVALLFVILIILIVLIFSHWRKPGENTWYLRTADPPTYREMAFFLVNTTEFITHEITIILSLPAGYRCGLAILDLQANLKLYRFLCRTPLVPTGSRLIITIHAPILIIIKPTFPFILIAHIIIINFFLTSFYLILFVNLSLLSYLSLLMSLNKPVSIASWNCRGLRGSSLRFKPTITHTISGASRKLWSQRIFIHTLISLILLETFAAPANGLLLLRSHFALILLISLS